VRRTFCKRRQKKRYDTTLFNHVQVERKKEPFRVGLGTGGGSKIVSIM